MEAIRQCLQVQQSAALVLPAFAIGIQIADSVVAMQLVFAGESFLAPSAVE